MRKFVAIAALSAAFLAFGPSLFAQATNGSITGTVTDATGAVINAATITIKNVDTGVTRSDLEIGICGEHGGDPRSVAFCHETKLDYVSCSPFRVPVARLSAAQATISGAATKTEG